MNVLMISKSEYPTDVRVRREAQALVDVGHHVEVITTDPGGLEIQGVKVSGIGAVSGITAARPRDSAAFRAARWILLPEHRQRAIKQFQESVIHRSANLAAAPDVIHAHDFPALLPAAHLAKRHSASLIYDSHEFWGGLPRYGRPEPWIRRSNLAQERELAHLADRVVTVSEGAADAIGRALQLNDISVIRNTFPIRDDLEVADQPSGAVYAGRIGIGRDLETAFAAAWWSRDRRLHLMGAAQPDFPLPSFVEQHPPGSMDEVDCLIAAVGIALITLTSGPANHDVALPNKLFQSIAAGVPVVAADLPEIRKVVVESGAGTLYEPGNPVSLTTALGDLVGNYAETKARLTESRISYDWSIDANRLVDIYASLATGGHHRKSSPSA